MSDRHASRVSHKEVFTKRADVRVVAGGCWGWRLLVGRGLEPAWQLREVLAPLLLLPQALHTTNTPQQYLSASSKSLKSDEIGL